MKITKLPNGVELCEYSDGFKTWWLDDKRHREDGPAMERANGNKEWWLNGKLIPTKKEFSQLLKLKGFW
jgi:hypothetical protein